MPFISSNALLLSEGETLLRAAFSASGLLGILSYNKLPSEKKRWFNWKWILAQEIN